MFLLFPLSWDPINWHLRRKGQKRGGYHIYIFSHLLLSPPTTPCSIRELLVLPWDIAFNAHLFPSYYKYSCYPPYIFLTPQQSFSQKHFRLHSMSSTAYLLLLFLGISLHACYARHLSPPNKKMEEKSHFSIKVSKLPSTIICLLCIDIYIEIICNLQNFKNFGIDVEKLFPLSLLLYVQTHSIIGPKK